MTRLRGLFGSDQPQETKFFLVIAAWGVAIGVVYWFFSYEPAGTVLLIGLGLANGLVAARLVLAERASVARRRSARSSEAAPALADPVGSQPGTGGVDRPFAAHGRIPDPTIAPLGVGLGVALVATGAIFGAAPVALGVVPLVWGALLWLGSAGDELDATRAVEAHDGSVSRAPARHDRA